MMKEGKLIFCRRRRSDGNIRGATLTVKPHFRVFFLLAEQ